MLRQNRAWRLGGPGRQHRAEECPGDGWAGADRADRGPARRVGDARANAQTDRAEDSRTDRGGGAPAALVLRRTGPLLRQTEPIRGRLDPFKETEPAGPMSKNLRTDRGRSAAAQSGSSREWWAGSRPGPARRVEKLPDRPRGWRAGPRIDGTTEPGTILSQTGPTDGLLDTWAVQTDRPGRC